MKTVSRRILVSLLALTMLTALLAGCSDSQGQSGTGAKTSITIMSAMPTDTFDPFPAEGSTPETQYAESQLSRDAVAMNMVYSHLVKIGEKGEVLPDIAESWDESSDEYITFTIRKDVKFSNGEALTADDVIFSLESYRESLFGSMTVLPYTTIEKVSDTEIKVGKLYPYSKTLEFIAMSTPIVSKEAYEAEGGKEAYRYTPVGSGPYIVEDINDAGDITFKRNDNYFMGKPDFETVVLRKPVSSAAALIELTAGTLDVLFNVTASDVKTVENNSALTVLSAPGASISFMTLHGEKYANKEFREAISLAIDKESLLGFALEGEGTVADKIFTKELLGDLDSQVNPLPGFDPEGAKEKLDASGVDKNAQYSILTDGTTSVVANAIKSNLTAIGLTNVEVETVDSPTLYARLQQGQYEMAFWSLGSFNQALEDAVGVFSTEKKPPNGSQYNWMYGGETEVINSAYQQIIAEGATKEQRDAGIVDIINNVHEEFFIVPLYSGNTFAVVNSSLDYSLANAEYSFIYVGDIKNK